MALLKDKIDKAEQQAIIDEAEKKAALEKEYKIALTNLILTELERCFNEPKPGDWGKDYSLRFCLRSSGVGSDGDIISVNSNSDHLIDNKKVMESLDKKGYVSIEKNKWLSIGALLISKIQEKFADVIDENSIKMKVIYKEDDSYDRSYGDKKQLQISIG